MPLIKLKVIVNGEREVEAIYDSGSNVTLINYNLMKELKTNLMEQRNLFNTVSGKNFTEGRAKIKLKVKAIEEDIDAYVIKNSSFSYDLLLGLDAIKKFRLIQDEKLDIHQRIGENRCEEIQRENKLDAGEEVSSNGKSRCLVSDFVEDKLQRVMTKLFEKHEELFAKNKFDVGVVKNHEARIKLITEKYV